VIKLKLLDPIEINEFSRRGYDWVYHGFSPHVKACFIEQYMTRILFVLG